MQRSTHVRAATIALPVTATVLTGAMGGFLVDLRTGFGSGVAGIISGLLVLALAGVYGLVVGEVLARVCGQVSNLRLEMVAAVSLVIGGLGGRVLIGCLVGCQMLCSIDARNVSHCATGLLLLVLSPMMLASLAVAVFAAISRIRTLHRSVAG